MWGQVLVFHPMRSSGAVAAWSAMQVTHITDDTTIEGNITCAMGITIAGELRGDVRAGGAVLIEEDGLVTGRVAGADVTVRGSVEGDVEASGKLVLTRGGKIHGDVRCRSLAVEEGGELLGRCDMGKAPAAPATKPVTAPHKTVPAGLGTPVPAPPRFAGAR